MADLNPLYDSATDNQEIAADSQARLNTPLAGGTIPAEDQEFLSKIMALVEDGTIQLYAPSSLLNDEVYEGLPLEGKSKADQNCVTMLGKIRDIINLEKADFDTNHQVANLIHSLRLNKERLEEHGGDIFII
ncbi:hypothetical protein HOD30_05020 [Candidatus Peregrinibacteria bacterium]|jgi:hypothetical protein|nr:hypothetical protein [Candidatus Peregrinibacteria bacterium]MBT4631386.1 hypothetical protein [Candidatus Peregrinibacteria bacterium]MBT5516379.1 hypothetical protein [Candidatus Peregrinibacteria bacterium]